MTPALPVDLALAVRNLHRQVEHARTMQRRAVPVDRETLARLLDALPPAPSLGQAMTETAKRLAGGRP